MRPFLKAGLIGGAILVVISFIGLVPVLGCVTLPLQLIGYLAVGALAAHYIPRAVNPAQQQARALWPA